jgi:hypothetical protein
MNICTGIVLSSVFVLMEARFGRSLLQHYQAILTGKWTSAGLSVTWRLVLVMVVVLPLVLSVAYKQLLGGTAESLFELDGPRTYGLDFPRIGSWAPSTLNSIYLLLTAFTPFWAAAGQGKGPYPSEPNAFPSAYGYNTLILDKDSAAVLDVPTTSYIAALQNELSTNEFLHISADVDAYVATLNTSLTASIATNDTLWTEAMASSIPQGGLSTIELYVGHGARLGIMPFGNNDRMLIGLFYDSDIYGDMRFHTNASDPDALRFRQRAHLYTLRRARCRGNWRLNSTGIFLDSGTCNSNLVVDSSLLRKDFTGPFAYDILPPLLHVYNNLVVDNSSDADRATPWLRPAYSLSVAAVYWARGLYMSQPPREPFTPYVAIEETVVSTRGTLRAGGWLYLVLAIHPVLTAVGFVVVCCLRRVPVGHDFSFVSIMAGLEPDGLKLIQGAGFSGDLKGPVRLDVLALYPGEETGDERKESGQIRYHLCRESESRPKKTSLRSGFVYD